MKHSSKQRETGQPDAHRIEKVNLVKISNVGNLFMRNASDNLSLVQFFPNRLHIEPHGGPVD
jgi:hypothetical protein